MMRCLTFLVMGLLSGLLFLGALTSPVRVIASNSQWQRMANPGGNSSCPAISAFASDPKNPDVLYASKIQGTDTRCSGLFKSIDGGQTWQLLTNGLPFQIGFSTIKIAPNNSDVVLAGSSSGLFLSQNAGANWKDITGNIFAQVGNPDIRTFKSIAISPDFIRDHTAFIGLNYTRTVGATVFRTTDAGASWQIISPERAFADISNIGISPNFAQDHTVFFLGGNSLYKSTDAGQAWLKLTTPASFFVGGSLAISPNFSLDHTLFAGGFGVIKSTDGGLTWSGSKIKPDLNDFITISPNFASNRMVVASAVDGKVYTSFGGDKPWTSISDGLNNDVSGLVNFVDNNRFILSSSDGLWLYTFSNTKLPSTPILPIPTGPNVSYFSETGHSLVLGFKSFWERDGGLAVFGFPLTEEFKEASNETGQTYTVQYFERQRYEYHADKRGTPYEVELGRLGADDAQQRGLIESPAFQNVVASTDLTCHYFPQTHHNVCGEYMEYWQSYGLEFGDPQISYRESLALFGYPISESFTQNGVKVQYFERAVFEYYPENRTPYKVLLRRLGASVLAQRGWFTIN